MAPSAWGLQQAARHRDIARTMRAAEARAAALVAEHLPPVQRKYRDPDDIGRTVARHGCPDARRAWAEALAARNELVTLTLGLADERSWRYRQHAMAEELRQEARLGLIDAAKRYDPENAVTFCSYAAWWVKARITRALTAMRPLRTPEYAHEQYRMARMLREEGHSEQWIAEEMGMPVERVRELFRIDADMVPLDTPVEGARNLRVHDTIPDEDAPDPDAVLDTGLRWERIRARLEALPRRQRVIIIRRYGLDGGDPETLEAISRRLNLSRERVRQIEAEAMAALRGEPVPRKGASGRARTEAYLAEHPWATPVEVAAALGEHLRSVCNRLARMAARGDVARIGQPRAWLYALPGTPVVREVA